MPGYSQYLSFINDLRDIWVGATGERAWHDMHLAQRAAWCLGVFMKPSCWVACWSKFVALTPIFFGTLRACVHCIATAVVAAGRWGIVATPLGMRRPNWSKVGPAAGQRELNRRRIPWVPAWRSRSRLCCTHPCGSASPPATRPASQPLPILHPLPAVGQLAVRQQRGHDPAAAREPAGAGKCGA